MKILHIARSDGWGAGTAAVRLHQGLMKIGVDSTFLCFNKVTDIKNVIRYQNKVSLFDKLLHKSGVKLYQWKTNERKLNGINDVFEAFTFSKTGFDIPLNLIEEADIINLHWISNFVDYLSFFKKINKPLVWTLHDMNSFLGGFHYMNDAINATGRLKEMDLKENAIKDAALESIDNLTIVSPSKWLLQYSAASKRLKRFPHRHIPYGLDVDTFKYIPQNGIRKSYRIPDDAKLILFISEDVLNIRKGFSMLKEAASKINREYKNVVFGIVGEHNEMKTEEKFVCFGKIRDNAMLAKIFSSADAFVIPSREDNFPNVMLESIACGTPVISFSNGGMAEVIRDNENGLLLHSIQSSALYNGIKDFIETNHFFDRSKIATMAREKYRLEIQAEKYLSLYKEILK